MLQLLYMHHISIDDIHYHCQHHHVVHGEGLVNWAIPLLKSPESLVIHQDGCLWPGQVGAEDRRLMWQLDSPKNLRDPLCRKDRGVVKEHRETTHSWKLQAMSRRVDESMSLWMRELSELWTSWTPLQRLWVHRQLVFTWVSLRKCLIL